MDLYFSQSFKQFRVSLNAHPSHLCHILIRTNCWRKVWTVHTVSLRKASHASSTAISFTAPSAAFYVPRPRHVANPTLFSSSSPPPHISPCHFNIGLLAPFRPLPPTPASSRGLAKAECLPPTRSGTADLGG